ncbi:MAG: hypothetical protein ACREEV_09660, partial [Dongiaceae bacterium]
VNQRSDCAGRSMLRKTGGAIPFSLPARRRPSTWGQWYGQRGLDAADSNARETRSPIFSRGG